MQNLANTMKSANLIGKTLSIALILILTLSSAVATLPTIKAQTSSTSTYTYTPTKGSNGLWNIPSFAGLTVSPDPVGVGQPVQAIMIIELLPPDQGTEASTGVTGGWQGLTLAVTTPNGTTTTLGPYESDVSGTYQVTYTPTSIGTYTFQFSFAGETVSNANQGTQLQYWANFLPAQSPVISLTVQQAQITGYTEAPVPLPNQYWTQPINAQNRAWNTISGPWLTTGYNSTGTFNPYTYAPMSAHILWAQSSTPLQYGLVGGQYGSLPFGGTSGVTGTGYPEVGLNSKGSTFIMGGYLYYISPVAVVSGVSQGTPSLVNEATSTISCMNLQTGQVVWTVPGPPNTSTNGESIFGQILDWRSQQQRMTLGYIWVMSSTQSNLNVAANTVTYQMYDAVNGQLLAQWTNLPAGTTVSCGGHTSDGIGGQTFQNAKITAPVTVYSGTVVEQEPNPTSIGENIGGGSGGGAVLVYIYGHNAGQSTGWLACWNSTLAINSFNNDPTVWNFLSTLTFPTIQMQLTAPLDWEWGIMWNMTIPLTSMTGSSASGGVTSAPGAWAIVGADQNDVILDAGPSSPNATGTEYMTLAAINIANQPMTTTYTSTTGGDTQHTTTGTLAWIENYTVPAYDQSNGGGTTPTLKSDGNIIVADKNTMDIWDFSEKTGALLWTSTPSNNDFGMQSQSPGTVALGMDFIGGYDGYLHALNISTGVQMWDVLVTPGGLEMPEVGYPVTGAYVAGSSLANGVVFTSTTKAYETMPAYRGHDLIALAAATGKQLWNISGEFTSEEIADGILIGFNTYDGREYAFGPGTTATTVTAPMSPETAGSPVIIQGTVTDQTPGLAEGTPAISDAWMTPWMEYLYMDQAIPTQATGVTVSLDAIDPNGNFIHIGKATSDISGTYIYQWTPPNVPGKYTIIATFSADNSYYGSSGETGMSIVSPTSATPAPTSTPTTVADMYFVPAIAGLFVLIIIVAIVLALLMLRRRP